MGRISDAAIAALSLTTGSVLALIALRLGWMDRFWDWLNGYGPAEVTAPAAPEIDEATYPPRVQEALDLIERETAAYALRERQAACSHERIESAEFRCWEDAYTTVERWCNGCGMKMPTPA